MKKVYFTAAVLGICTLVWADEPPMQMPARADTKEFQQMKQLVGTWKGTKEPAAPGETKSEPVEVNYKLTAGGSTVEETLMPGTPHEMVTMYHDESGKLTMTHYCMLGNTPHMAATKATAKEIQFTFVPGSGIDPAKDAHMDALTLEFTDPDHLVQKWSCHQSGKPNSNAIFILTRVKA